MAWFDTYDPSGGDIKTSPTYYEGAAFNPIADTWYSSYTADKWGEVEETLRSKNMKTWQEIQNLEAIKQYYQGSGDFVALWLLDNSIKQLHSRMEDTDRAIGMGQTALIRAKNRTEGAAGQGWNTPTATGTRLSDYEKWKGMAAGGGTRENAEYKNLEIPEWLQPYLETSQGVTGAGGTAYTLRPLGAQADVSMDQFPAMQSYMTWKEAGSPRTFGENYVSASQKMPDRWEEYVKLSQKLFPQAGKGEATTWATARR
jgi:hypothetical protein